MKTLAPLVCVLALTACASPPSPETFAPLDYSYLHPIILKVANLNVVDNYVPGAAETQLNANNPAPPGATLMAMLNHRLQPSGQPGTGTVTVQIASVTETNGYINGQMTVDINLSSPDGRTTGFTEATYSASETAPDSDASQNDVQAALYQMTKKLMENMNVQIPYAITHNIPSWVVYTAVPGMTSAPQSGPGVVPGSIQAAPLSAPPVSDAAPAAATPVPPPETSSGAVPDYLPGAGPAALTTPQAPAQ